MEIHLLPYQDRFVFSEHKYTFMTAGWATGKSMCLILACLRQCDLYPNNLGIIYRREAVDLRDSTIKQFELMTGKKVDSKRDATFSNGSVIMFRHSEELLGNVQNVNLGFAAIEEHAEIENDELFYTLFGRLRRANAGLKMYSVGNARGHDWVYKISQNGLYDENKKRMDLHIEATTYQNPNLSKEFIASLEILKTQKPALYRRFVLNSHDDEDTVDIIIRPEWVRQAVNRELKEKHYTRKVVVCDPARFGDDETVIYVLENGEIIDSEVYTQKSAMETCGWMVKMSEKHQVKDIALDVCGMGAPMFDRLIELNRQVIPVNSAENATDRNRYRNVRAEMWHRAAELFEAGEVSIPNDEILIEQLSGVRYKTIESNGRFQVESKEDIKSPKRLGTSPDRADCLVMGLWALDRVQATYRKDYGLKSQKKASYGFNPMTV